MTTLRSVVDGLSRAADSGESVVLATVVRVTGSSYGGVGARMLVRVDGSTVGLVSGGCLESDIAEHALRVHLNRNPEVVTYDTRDDDDAPWGLGLGCNGLIEVLLEPLDPERALAIAALLDRALSSDAPSVLATVTRVTEAADGSPGVGAHVLFTGDSSWKTGDWGQGLLPATASAATGDALAAGRRGFVHEYGGVELAFEVVIPAVHLLVCGSGPDAAPIVHFGCSVGWDVIVVDHRPPVDARAGRFPGARVIECSEPLRVAEAVSLTARTAGVVVSHHFARDLDYVQALLISDVCYVGVLGPRARTRRMLDELAARGVPLDSTERIFAPVGLDIGGDGPEAIALAIITEISAVTNGRSGGHLRDRRGPMHADSRQRANSR